MLIVPTPGKQAAPVLDQDVGEKADQQRKGGPGDLAADDGGDQVEHPLDQTFDDGLARRRNQLGFPDREADRDDQKKRHDPAGHHAVGHRQGAEAEQNFRLGRHAALAREGAGTGAQKDQGEAQFFDQWHRWRTVVERWKRISGSLTLQPASTTENNGGTIMLWDTNGRDGRRWEEAVTRRPEHHQPAVHRWLQENGKRQRGIGKWSDARRRTGPGEAGATPDGRRWWRRPHRSRV